MSETVTLVKDASGAYLDDDGSRWFPINIENESSCEYVILRKGVLNPDAWYSVMETGEAWVSAADAYGDAEDARIHGYSEAEEDYRDQIDDYRDQIDDLEHTVEQLLDAIGLDMLRQIRRECLVGPVRSVIETRRPWV